MADTREATGLRHPDRFWIGGEWVAPSSGDTFDVLDSTTEEVVLRVAEAKAADIDRAVTAARTAFDEGPWPSMTHAARADHLRAIGEGIRARSDELARLWTAEVGVLRAMAVASTPTVAKVWDFYAGLADTFAFVERHTPSAGGSLGLLVREPVGVVGAIVPWNGPLALAAYKVAPALLAGCTVVLKMSPEAPSAGLHLAEIAEEVGLPPGVLNVVTADREASEELVRDPRVDKITFTGSTAAGRRIGGIMGERIGRHTLELGGKSAAIVLDDYDVEAAAATLGAYAVVWTGQICSSLTRVIVPERRHDDFVEALSAAMGKVKVGDPSDPTVGMGPLAMERQRARVEHYIAEGHAGGAVLATGGGRPKDLDRGWFVEPTVFGRVDNASTIAQEEIFGPVVSVITARDEDDAVRIANDTVYGLNASVFTTDDDRAYALARRLRSGTVGPSSFRSDFGIAFGGFKQSGVGREGGVEGLLPFLEAKTVILDGLPAALAADGA